LTLLLFNIIISIIIHILCAISLHVGGTIEFTVLHFCISVYIFTDHVQSGPLCGLSGPGNDVLWVWH